MDSKSLENKHRSAQEKFFSEHEDQRYDWNIDQRNLQKTIDDTDYYDPYYNDYYDPYYNDDYLSGIYRDADEWDPYLANPYYDDFYLLQDKQLFGDISNENEYDYLLQEAYKND